MFIFCTKNRSKRLRIIIILIAGNINKWQSQNKSGGPNRLGVGPIVQLAGPNRLTDWAQPSGPNRTWAQSTGDPAAVGPRQIDPLFKSVQGLALLALKFLYFPIFLGSPYISRYFVKFALKPYIFDGQNNSLVYHCTSVSIRDATLPLFKGIPIFSTPA